jgi:hypothetical protein
MDALLHSIINELTPMANMPAEWRRLLESPFLVDPDGLLMHAMEL